MGWDSQKEWLYPKHKKILIFDKCGSEYLKPFFKNYSYCILAVRGEAINIPCLIEAVIRYGLKKNDLWEGYLNIFIKKVAPILVLTFIDNNKRFYLISKKFPNLKTIFIQNGFRGEIGDVFYSLKKIDGYFVDYMFVFGNAIAKKYSEYIFGETIVAGSLKNNMLCRSAEKNSNIVLFISQWRPEINGDDIFIRESDGVVIFRKQFYEAEFKVIRFLDNWCKRNNKILTVCGYSDDKNEMQFFSSLIDECEWRFVPGNGELDSYGLVDSAGLIVFIDSTLGYEAIARGKKSAVLSCRDVSLGTNTRGFGWPKKYPKNGLFWTNEESTIEFERVMNFLNTIDNDTWIEIINSYQDDIMAYDSGNKILTLLLNELLN